jgi:glycosyltransferase involved in cell wall biosynthesis
MVDYESDMNPPKRESLRVAVLIPCLNEEDTVGVVVASFRQVLPTAQIFVYDNDSNDRTAETARRSGASVRCEPLRGKGHVVCRMFSDVDADLYVLVDGDNTYDAKSVGRLIHRLLAEDLEMVCGARVTHGNSWGRSGHRLGNLLLSRIVTLMFSGRVEDMLTGYRVFTRRFVKTFPALSTGFEIETQLTVHALSMHIPFAEERTPYNPRADWAESKLRTFEDGWRILRTILYLVKDERPLGFFTFLFVLLASSSVGLAWPIVIEFMQTGLVPRFPTAILATSLMLLGFLCLASGIILDSVKNGRQELKRMQYLAMPRLRQELVSTVQEE